MPQKATARHRVLQRFRNPPPTLPSDDLTHKGACSRTEKKQGCATWEVGGESKCYCPPKAAAPRRRVRRPIRKKISKVRSRNPGGCSACASRKVPPRI
jgi:hypothetical protein